MIQIFATLFPSYFWLAAGPGGGGGGGKGGPKMAEPLFTGPTSDVPGITLETAADWQAYFLKLGLSALTIVVIFIAVFYGLRLVFRRMNSDPGLVSLRASQLPAAIVAGISIIKSSFAALETYQAVVWIEAALTAVIYVTVAFWIGRLLDQVVFYYLKQYAEKTEAQWDDVLVPILETVVPVLVYVIGVFLALQSLGLNLTGLWVAFGGITFVIGYALQDIIANFFGGLVLLIDTPFRFGDVIGWKKNERAVIKKVGLRLTQLYLIDQHCEVYVPNSKFEKQKILNLSRPNPNYYYTLTMHLPPESEASRTMDIMEKVALAHPDTLGDISLKLELIDQYFGRAITNSRTHVKLENGRKRLLAEREANRCLSRVEEMFDDLSSRIDVIEDDGLSRQEIRSILDEFTAITEVMGLGIETDRTRKVSRLVENSAAHIQGSLIGHIRTWYEAWTEDPDLFPEDQHNLRRAWEQRIELLTNKTNKLFQALSNTDADDTRVDDAVSNLYLWIQESFKTSRNEWQKPRIWTTDVTLGRGQLLEKEFAIRFYVDDITLERFQRGYRVESEINQEISWHLRRVFLVH